MSDKEDDRTLLEKIPPTDPAIFTTMENSRLANAHYAAIGQVAAQWAYFEAVVNTWLTNFAQMTPEVGLCFTAQMFGWRAKIDTFIALVRHLGAKKKWNGPLEHFAQDAHLVSIRRNRTVHDMWQLDDATNPRRLEATAARSVRLTFVEEPTTDLVALVISITTLAVTFDDMASTIFTEIHSKPSPSPDTT